MARPLPPALAPSRQVWVPARDLAEVGGTFRADATFAKSPGADVFYGELIRLVEGLSSEGHYSHEFLTQILLEAARQTILKRMPFVGPERAVEEVTNIFRCSEGPHITSMLAGPDMGEQLRAHLLQTIETPGLVLG